MTAPLQYHVVFVPPYPHIMRVRNAQNQLNALQNCLRLCAKAHPPVYHPRRPLKRPGTRHIIQHVVPLFFRAVNPTGTPLRPKHIRVQRLHTGEYHVSLRVRELKRWCPVMLVKPDYTISAILYDLSDTVMVRGLYHELGLTDPPSSLRHLIRQRSLVFHDYCRSVPNTTANGHDVRCRMSEGLLRLADPAMSHLIRRTRHIHYISSVNFLSAHIDSLDYMGAIRYATLNDHIVASSLRQVDDMSTRALRLVRNTQERHSHGNVDALGHDTLSYINESREAMLDAQLALDVANTAATAHRALNELEKIIKTHQLKEATGAVLCRRR